MLKNGQELVRTKLDGSLRASLHIELLPFAREANQASVNSFIHPHVFHPCYIHVHWIWNLGEFEQLGIN